MTSSLGPLVGACRRRLLRNLRSPGAWVERNVGRPAVVDAFVRPSLQPQSGPPVHRRWIVDEYKWSLPVRSIYYSTFDPNRPGLLDFQPTCKRVSTFSNESITRVIKHGSEERRSCRRLSGPILTGNAQPNPMLSDSSFNTRRLRPSPLLITRLFDLPSNPDAPGACPHLPSLGTCVPILPRPAPMS